MQYSWENRLEYANYQAREILGKLVECNSVEEREKAISLAIRETMVEVAIDERNKAEIREMNK